MIFGDNMGLITTKLPYKGIFNASILFRVKKQTFFYKEKKDIINFASGH